MISLYGYNPILILMFSCKPFMFFLFLLVCFVSIMLVIHNVVCWNEESVF
jgi:hypothetical protein